MDSPKSTRNSLWDNRRTASGWSSELVGGVCLPGELQQPAYHRRPRPRQLTLAAKRRKHPSSSVTAPPHLYIACRILCFTVSVASSASFALLSQSYFTKSESLGSQPASAPALSVSAFHTLSCSLNNANILIHSAVQLLSSGSVLLPGRRYRLQPP
ncbi:hypothetical protein VTN00DRAFT_6160 [Thermoascus crustaceus]|uniref:uncharacterized protein n=1 Tax=Thermoascus crustaceus TaxID=5088 RepID=UPI0037429B21